MTLEEKEQIQNALNQLNHVKKYIDTFPDEYFQAYIKDEICHAIDHAIYSLPELE